MKTLCFMLVAFVLFSVTFLVTPPAVSQASDSNVHLEDDALLPPPRPRTAAFSDNYRPGLYQPSAFLAGRIAVQVLLVESNGSAEPSTTNWSAQQVADVKAQIAAALNWWQTHLPNARLDFDLQVRTVASSYEPIHHTLAEEGMWIGDALARIGINGNTYFDQSYLAADTLRKERNTDWATTIFVANSAGVPGGRFADNRFAYAYINGPFMVITSDAGPYGIGQMATVVAHEFGHIFGALDQYAAAGTSCTQHSGYLSIPTSNSQAQNCGTHFPSIMLEPLTAYANGDIDASALGQLGYRDTDGDALIDPQDTAPVIDVQVTQIGGGRPTASIHAFDQPFPSPTSELATMNIIDRIEYRIDGSAWFALPAADSAYDSASEDSRATLPLYDGQHVVDIRAINSIGSPSQIKSTAFAISGVGTAPAFAIDAPAITDVDIIPIRIDAPNGATVQLSESALFTAAPWTPVPMLTEWRLQPGDGVHVIYARLRDAQNLETPPTTFQVLLDRTPPSGRAILHKDATQWLEIQAHDDGSGLDAMQIGSGNNSWQTYTKIVTLSLQNSDILVRVRDEAGNISPPLPVIAAGPVYIPISRR